MPQPPQLRRSLAIPAEQSGLGGAPAVPDLRSFMGHRYPVAPRSPLAQSRLTRAATAAAVWPHTPIDGALAVFRPRAITAGRRSGDSCPTFSTTPSVPSGMPSRTRSRSLREPTGHGHIFIGEVIPRRRSRFGPAQSRRCPGPSPTRRATSGHRRRGGLRTGGRSRGPVPPIAAKTFMARPLRWISAISAPSA